MFKPINKTGNAVKWSFVTELMAKLITPITNIILARLLAPEAFGAVATLTMIITFAEVFTDAGFQKYIVQHEFATEEELERSTSVAFWTNLFLSLIIALLIVVFRNPIAMMVGSPKLGNAIAISSSIIVLAAFSSIQMARFKRELDFKSLFFVRIGAALIPLIITVPLAFVMRNFNALLIGNILVNLFTAIVLSVRSRWRLLFFFDFGLLKKMLSFTIWTTVESVTIWLTMNVDIFIVGKVLNDYYLGVYKTAITTTNSIMSIITSAIVPVLFSALSRCQNDDAEFKKTYWSFFKYTSILVIPLGVGMFVYRDLLTTLLLGNQWGEAAGFIGLWGFTGGFTILFSNFASEVYRSRGNPKISTFAQALLILLIIPSVLIAARHGFTALYTTRSMLRLVFIIENVILLAMLYRINPLKMLLNIWAPVIATLIMAVSGYLFLRISPLLWQQIISVFVCIVIYFAVLLALQPSLFRDLTKFLKSRKKRLDKRSL